MGNFKGDVGSESALDSHLFKLIKINSKSIVNDIIWIPREIVLEKNIQWNCHLFFFHFDRRWSRPTGNSWILNKNTYVNS